MHGFYDDHDSNAFDYDKANGNNNVLSYSDKNLDKRN